MTLLLTTAIGAEPRLLLGAKCCDYRIVAFLMKCSVAVVTKSKIIPFTCMGSIADAASNTLVPDKLTRVGQLTLSRRRLLLVGLALSLIRR